MLSSIRNLTILPWKLRARLQFAARGVQWPKNFKVLGPLGLSAAGEIKIGKNVSVVSLTRFNRAGINHPTQLVAAKGAKLTIGDKVGISGASIFCTESIEIGNHVLVGASCRIYDTDFHPVDHMDRRMIKDPPSAPVTIGDDVWLCANVTVLKGVTIGARSVIATGSIVTRDIPPDTLAGGIPAKPIRSLLERDS